MNCDIPVRRNAKLHPRTVALPVSLYLDMAASLAECSLNVRVVNRDEVELSSDLFDSMDFWLDAQQLFVAN